ncbi:hypothetical protein [Niastella populi]|uniref:Glycosyltransferase RgtA/B/C/D-like domain-containing protein n=1 Tax=Niastella populi TaxID=550983 RepID=A0A1V9G828_9BACT|nr:hypothetical protein [Niastella populi]OQP66626.1 hypothetical protein A4R26_12630 [Niastella populi]
MNERMSISPYEMSFKEFLLKNKRNRAILWIAGIAIVLQFCIFKYFYPYASYIHGDSFSYLNTAHFNLDINTYMVGYSRFIRLFSVFTSSDTALVSFQYLFIQSSALFLLFTLFYFYKLSRVIQIVLLCFMVFNPLFWHLGNLISSDCFFASLSLVWFALLLWLINRPSTRVIVWHAVVLFLAFTVRYNALIYPFISAAVFWLSKLPVRQKVMGIGAGAILCFLFVFYTSYKYKQLTGYWQYSPFSGWQFANNAMYAYRYVDSAERKPVAKKYQVLDNMIREYFDSTRDVKKHPTEAVLAGTYYMWSFGMPLYKYREKIFKKDTTAGELKKWASMGPYFKSYGLYIIRKYPSYFVRYFLWPNASKYYAPPVEFLAAFNSGRDSVVPLAKDWFGYKSLKISTRTKANNHEIHILDFYPILSGVINVVMIMALLSFYVLNGFSKNNQIRQAIFLGGSIWLINAGFTIFASSAALRFQSFPILLTTTFTLILIDWIWNMASQKQVVNPIEAGKIQTSPITDVITPV